MNQSIVDNTTKCPVIFLHGWGMNHLVWSSTIESLSQLDPSREMMALDLPGYGIDVKHNDALCLVDMANKLAQKIETRAVIVGWSLGGMVALKLAEMFPEKVEKLVLIASTPKFMQQQDWPGIKPEVLQLFSAQLKNEHRKVIERFLAIQAMGSKTARSDIKVLKDKILSLPLPNISVLEKGLDILQHEDLRESYSNCNVPISMLFGRLDSLVPASQVDLLRTLLPTAEINVLAHASHAPFISHPAETLSFLIESLA
jgi:pimeloyl-[acyl-carrier protein] methyl ester esterase